jgi:hypothetical protein
LLAAAVVVEMLVVVVEQVVYYQGQLHYRPVQLIHSVLVTVGEYELKGLALQDLV